MCFYPVISQEVQQALTGGLDQNQRAIRLNWGSHKNQLTQMLIPQRIDIHEGLCTGIDGQITCLSPDSGLPLQSLLGLPVSLQLVTDLGALHPVNAIVTRAQAGQSDGSLSSIQISIGDVLSVLDKRINSRIFRSMRVPDIIATLLREWRQRSSALAQAFDFDFLLNSKGYPEREQTRQVDESDAAFIRRLCRREGIFWFCKAGVRGEDRSKPNASPMHTLVFCDDPMRLDPSPTGKLRYHRNAATEQRDAITLWSVEKTLMPGSIRRTSWDYKTGHVDEIHQPTLTDHGEVGNELARLLADSFMDVPHAGDSRSDYERLSKMRIQAHEYAAHCIHGVSGVRNAQVATWFELLEHPEVDKLELQQRQFIITSLHHRAENNLPKTLHERGQALFKASHWPSDMGWKLGHGDHHSHSSGDVPTRYENTFTCVSKEQPLTPSYDPRIDLPRVHPTTALVVGPEGEEVHCDELGRIKVQLLGLQAQDHAHAQGAGTSRSERDSAWVRCSSSWAGPNYGHDTLPRAGMEVLINHLHGDPDKMFVAGVLHNGPNMPATFSHKGGLPGNRYISGVKTKEIKGRRYNQLRFDDTASQISSQLASEHAHSQLNLGYLTHPRENGSGQARGEGAELRSDAHVAIRSGRAMLISAWQKLNASQSQLAREECLSLMQECVQLFKSLGDYAAQHQGEAMQTQQQEALSAAIKSWPEAPADNSASSQAEAAIAMTAPEGISLATPKAVVTHAGGNIDHVAQQHLQFTSGQRLNMHAGRGVSMFAHQDGVSAIANQGLLKLQSQADNTQIDSAKNINLTAAGGKISGMASEQVVLVTSGGAYLKLDGGNVEIGCPGSFTVKAASHTWAGPASMSTDFPSFGKDGLGRVVKLVRASDGQQLSGYEGEVRNAAGKLLGSGTSDAAGQLSPLESEQFEPLSIQFFKKAD